MGGIDNNIGRKTCRRLVILISTIGTLTRKMRVIVKTNGVADWFGRKSAFVGRAERASTRVKSPFWRATCYC